VNHEEVDKISDALMAQYGVPERIRTDNGTPFSSISGLGISRLSIKWMQLGIIHERIDPGRPTQNGRHERLHRTLKEDAATPPAKSLKIQRQRHLEFTRVFNHERPHQALDMNMPASLYSASNKRFLPVEPDLPYDSMYAVRAVRGNGTIRWKNHEIFITEVLRGQKLGLLQSDQGHVDVYFGTFHLGGFDQSLRFVAKGRHA
jgi:hypothetical protein